MGVLGVFRDAVTIVNRTIGAGEFEQDLTVRYDGEDIVLKPGENFGFPAIAVQFAKRQNKLMGSQHPINPNRFISLVGVKTADPKQQKDDITPIPEETLRKAAQKLEVVDRSGEFYNRPMRQNVKVLNQGYDPYEAMADPGALMGDPNAALDAKLG